MESDFKYYAFISYVHEDKKQAEKLQKKLETYKIPTSLAKEIGKEFPKKPFYPCFRDYTSFSKAGTIAENIQEGLQNSQYLIVVCSPRSADPDRWVNTEVKDFIDIRQGNEKKIIPFIIQGKPNSSDSDICCYPPNLDKDILGFSVPDLGKKIARLKIIAAMLNVPFEVLKNRERERNLKNGIWIAVASIITLVIFSAIVVWRNSKISEQYARAEKLINAFYFYDDKYALAYGTRGYKELGPSYYHKIDKKENVFYYIDKNGNAVEKLGYWQKAEQFDEGTGFAKVSYYDVGDVYLLDIFGNTYKYTNEVSKWNSEIQALDLPRQNLSKLPELIENLTNLIYLDLHGNQLNVLPSEIGNLTNLRYLNLNGNDLRVLPSEIGNLTNLVSLNWNWNWNGLSVLPSEIGNLRNLKILNLRALQSNSFRTYIPLEVQEKIKLKLSVLPPEIGNLVNLTELDLSWNGLNVLPPEIGKLTNLTSLMLKANRLSALPPEIGNLTSLVDLNLSFNGLNVLPSEISKLTNLTNLCLFRNNLSVLPPEIGKLRNLINLDLNGNQINVLPPEIGNLTDLTRLILQRNQLSVLPPEIGKLTNLVILDLSSNQLSVLPAEIGSLTSLVDLNLSYNGLNVLPSKISKLTNLTHLILRRNQLSILPPKIGKLTNLAILDLNNNQLSVLPPEIGKLKNLTRLDLGDNQLTSLPPEIEKLTKLEYFSWYGNPLDSQSVERAKRIENRILQNREK